MLFTRPFLIATLERAVKTFAQSLLAVLTAAGTDVAPAVNWGDKLAIAGYAAAASVLFSIVSSGFGATGPSLANEVISPPAVDPGPKDGGYGAIELLVAVLVVVILVLLILRLA